jgi:hypothetical protein
MPEALTISMLQYQYMPKPKGFYKEGGKTKPIVGSTRVSAAGNPQVENAARRELLNSKQDGPIGKGPAGGKSEGKARIET